MVINLSKEALVALFRGRGIADPRKGRLSGFLCLGGAALLVCLTQRGEPPGRTWTPGFIWRLLQRYSGTSLKFINLNRLMFNLSHEFSLLLLHENVDIDVAELMIRYKREQTFK